MAFAKDLDVSSSGKDEAEGKCITEQVKNGTAITPVKCNTNYLVSRRVLVTKDNRFILCGSGNRILVHSHKTGKLYQEFSIHSSTVVDFHFVVKHPSLVISGDKTGCILQWDYTNGTVVKKFQLSSKISSLILHPKQSNIIFVTRKEKSKEKKKDVKDKFELLKVDLDNTKDSKNQLNGIVLCMAAKSAREICLNNDGDYIASIKQRNLQVFSVKNQVSTRFKNENAVFTCVAFHPTQLLIATGDTQGKIILWQTFSDDRLPITTEMHWHAHPVQDLCFTHDGVYLLSGGEESVLVTWQIETLEKDFLPRLGGPIQNISVSPDDSLFIVCLKTNVVKVISATDKKLSRTLQGLTDASTLHSGINYDPRSSCLVLPGSPSGHLQFYRPEQDSIHLTLDVVGQNYISGVEHKPILHTEVENVAFSYDGNWLATVERGKYKLIPEEIKLKFWSFDKEFKRYHLNTLANPPHQEKVISLKFRPEHARSNFEHMVVSTGREGKFKVWAFNKGGDAQELKTWQCHSVCYYGNSSCGPVAFSEDGSLVAVGYDQVVTIWDPESSELRTTLINPTQNENIWKVVFGYGSSASYLLVQTNHYIVAWNLLTCSVWWSLETKVTALVADPYSSYFVAFANFQVSKDKSHFHTHLYVFDPLSPKPVAVVSNVSLNCKIISAVFCPPQSKENLTDKTIWHKIGRLYYLNEKGNIYKIPVEESEPRKWEITNDQDEEDASQADFIKIFGFSTSAIHDSNQVSDGSTLPKGTPTSAVVKKILSTPSHVLPPVTSLCSVFVKSAVVSTMKDKRSNENYESSSEEESEETETLKSKQTNGKEPADTRRYNNVQKNNLANEIEFKQLESLDFTWLSQFFNKSP